MYHNIYEISGWTLKVAHCIQVYREVLQPWGCVLLIYIWHLCACCVVFYKHSRASQDVAIACNSYKTGCKPHVRCSEILATPLTLVASDVMTFHAVWCCWRPPQDRGTKKAQGRAVLARFRAITLSIFESKRNCNRTFHTYERKVCLFYVCIKY